MCFGCHQRMGGNPLEFTEWMYSRIGRDRMEALRKRKECTLKIGPHLKDIAKHFQREYVAMRGGRGHHFVRWRPDEAGNNRSSKDAAADAGAPHRTRTSHRTP